MECLPSAPIWWFYWGVFCVCVIIFHSERCEIYHGCLCINITSWTLNYFNQKCLSRVCASAADQQHKELQARNLHILQRFGLSPLILVRHQPRLWDDFKPALRIFVGCGLQICHRIIWRRQTGSPAGFSLERRGGWLQTSRVNLGNMSPLFNSLFAFKVWKRCCSVQRMKIRTARVWNSWDCEWIFMFLGNVDNGRRNRWFLVGVLEGLWPLIFQRSQKSWGFKLKLKAAHAMYPCNTTAYRFILFLGFYMEFILVLRAFIPEQKGKY